jgi:DNA-binding CsgD family transcriptional regulator
MHTCDRQATWQLFANFGATISYPKDTQKITLHGILSQLRNTMNNNSPLPLSSSPSSQQGFIGFKPSADKAAPPALLATLTNALDEIACGVIILNSQGQMLHCNLAGRVQLDRHLILQLDHGIVSPVRSEDAPRFQEGLAKALAGKRSMLNLGQISVSGSASGSTNAPPATIAMVPLDRHAEQEFVHGVQAAYNQSAHNANSAESQKYVALIFSRTGMCEALMMSFFARAHQLTRSEEQILGLLCTGLTAPEMATQLRVGEATVRTHIRSICQKTHSNGIREVTKRLALLPPLMAAVMPAAFA